MGNPTIIETEDDGIVIVSPAPVAIVVSPVISSSVSNSSGGSPLYRGIINYDGGHAGTKYGDAIVLNGGWAAGSRLSI